jgi:NADH:ubiquinone oxidoreductase subunit 5 (subunit L)/multisubunit Na+/H+ antiporter MnhA subunit
MLLLIVFVPLIGAFILPIAGRISVKLRNLLALSFVLVSLVLTMIISLPIFRGEAITADAIFNNVYNFVLYADGLAVFMAFVSALISAIIIFYSFGYISHYENQDEYYLMVVLFFGGMMGLVFSGNLIFLYLFWEITAITSWRLIGFFREKQHVLLADKAFMVTMFGSVLMLLGFISIYQQTGSFEMAAIKDAMGTGHLSNLAAALILAGILSKSATLPLHTWLPDAGVAPSPVTALLHAALLISQIERKYRGANSPFY